MTRHAAAALFATLLSAGTIHAQETTSAADAVPLQEEPATRKWESVRIGLKAGATWSTLRGELAIPEVGSVGFEGDFGFVAGASVEVPIGAKVSLQPEGHLIRKFSELALDVDEDLLRQKLSVNYLELPLLLKWYPGDRDGVQGNLVIGPMASVRLGATLETRRNGQIVDSDAQDFTDGMDWGVLLGGGFEFGESFASLTIDVRYAHGFQNVDITESGAMARWSVIHALVGVTF